MALGRVFGRVKLPQGWLFLCGQRHWRKIESINNGQFTQEELYSDGVVLYVQEEW
jgi:hypothetical protein